MFADVDWELIGTALQDAGFDGPGHSSPDPPSDDEPDAVLRLLVGLSRMAEDTGSDWMDQELCTTPAHYRADAEAKKNQMLADRAGVLSVAPMHRVQERRSDQRCARGECCVYSVWFSSKYSRLCRREQRHCNHVCGSDDERKSIHCPSLFESGLFQEFSSWDSRPDMSGSRCQSLADDAGAVRWLQCGGSKRRKQDSSPTQDC